MDLKEFVDSERFQETIAKMMDVEQDAEDILLDQGLLLRGDDGVSLEICRGLAEHLYDREGKEALGDGASTRVMWILIATMVLAVAADDSTDINRRMKEITLQTVSNGGN